ncbi:MAG: DUF1292 domain-containing protein [Erysipelotrichaceae bacterium]|nr:DUF1292 domain-containing protein [Erysipelotrichaceae bacterium]
MLSDTNKIILTDDEGNEKEFEILFTFDYEATGKQYVVVQNPANEDEVFGFSYNDEGEVFPVDEEEFEIVAEVFDAWRDESNE